MKKIELIGISFSRCSNHMIINPLQNKMMIKLMNLIIEINNYKLMIIKINLTINNIIFLQKTFHNSKNNNNNNYKIIIININMKQLKLISKIKNNLNIVINNFKNN